MRRVALGLCKWLALLSVLYAQTGGVLERLQRYQQQYDEWASQHTFFWQIVYSESNNLAAVEQELTSRRETGHFRILTPPSMSVVAHLTIARTPELSMVVLKHVSGDWFPGYSKVLRIYRGRDWLSVDGGEAGGVDTEQISQTVYIIPLPQGKHILLDSLSFAPTLHPAFFAGTSPFEPAFKCIPRPEWLLDKATDSQIILKQLFENGAAEKGGYYLILHPEGWVQEFQVRPNPTTIQSRITVLKTQRHGNFVVPSEVLAEFRWKNFSQARLVARLVRLEKTGTVKVEHPIGAHVSDYRLTNPDQWCTDGAGKVVNYIWKGQLPTLTELEQRYQAASPPAGIPIPPARQGRWWLYLPGILLVVAGAYLWWRSKRVTKMG
ncbi:hypothetical protein DCOP10_10733 [Armatimonadetes bacterium DC]|jgi:hypothetical protein|nr:hypothetical protein HRbin14_00848 [bacterium HR14]CUU34331.1 hypothetical protein DCOP10_10733 [Armatimonadetes bacterium DC]